MPEAQIHLQSLHPGQLTVINNRKRFNTLAMGRRWGKTVLGQKLAIDPALAGFPVGWFSPSYKLLIDVWRDLRNALQPIIARSNVQERRIELTTGGVIEMWSLDNADAGRGRKYARIIVDEAAMVKSLTHAWSASLRPTLTDYAGDGWFLSTPKGRNGFWQLYQSGQDDTNSEWASWHMPTATNPFIDPAEIEAARKMLPERIYAQEYLAQFLEDAGGVFRRVMDAATATEQAKAEDGTQYVMGADWGKSNDFTVLTVLDTNGRMVHLDRFNQIDYQVQLGRLQALAERFKPSAIIAEQNSMGAPLAEQLLRMGLPVQPFNTTNATKTAIIDGLALAFERGDIAILPDPTLIGELQAYEMERLPSGLLRYSAPDGLHDDTVMSLALAWYGIGKPTAKTLVDFA